MRRPTGISTYALNLLPYLSCLSPTLLSAQQIDSYSCYLISEGKTPEQGVKGHLRRLFWTQLQLPQIYQQLESELLFSPLPEAPLYSKCRSVVMVHDLIPLRFPQPLSPLTFYFRYYIPQVLNQAEHIICNSHATATDITNFFGISAKKITPIPLGYDTVHFRPGFDPSLVKGGCFDTPQPPFTTGGSLVPPLYKGGLGGVETDNKPPYFLYLGRHEPYKNLQRLISAFARVSNCKEYQLWLVGSYDKRYTPKLEKQAIELGLEKQVKFLGYVTYEELPGIMQKAIALVFPSLWEGFGLPVLEAMACGTPVITSNISALPEVAGDAALLVNPYNTREITTAMETVSDPKMGKYLSQLSLKQASNFSWEKTGKSTVEIIHKYV